MSEIVLDPDAPQVIIRVMLTTDRAVDLFLGDLARRGYSERTRTTYSRLLDKLAARFPSDWDVSRITSDDVRHFLDQWNGKAAGTRAHVFAVLSSFFAWLVVNEKIKRSPLATMARPKRQRPDDLDVVSVSKSDVQKLLASGETWTEKLAVAIPVYLGPRRRAVAQLRLRDYDPARHRMRFREKGGKIIWKRVPDELARLLAAAMADGTLVEPDDFLVPPEGYLHRAGDRDDRVIWRVVKRVALRAGVNTHVHALRAAFAVQYLEQHPGDTHALKALLGHRSFETTNVYLRKADTEVAMERVADLTWTDDSDDWGDVLQELTSFVYFIVAGDIDIDGTPVKIGTAADPAARMADLQCGHHTELFLAATLPGGRLIEQKLHAACATDHLRGEWYAASPQLRSLLKTLANQAQTRGDAYAGTASLAEVGAGGFEPPLPELHADAGDAGQHSPLDAAKPRIAELRESSSRRADR